MNVRNSIMISSTVATWMFAALSGNACETVAGWKAQLLGKTVVPAVASPATGLASFDFTLDQPQITVTLDTSDLQGVTEIDLRHAYVGSNGPLVAKLYDAKDGALPTHLAKTLTAADVPLNPTLHIGSFADFATMIVNGGVYLVVCTQAHPEGEIRGQVNMIKTRVYSATEDGRGHDPSLHAAHGALTTQTKPATP